MGEKLPRMAPKQKSISPRLFYPSRAPISYIIISLSAALVFFLILHNYSYLKFPKHIATLKGDKEREVFDFERDFSVAGESGRNSWALEIELFESAGSEAVFHVLINGTPVKMLKAKGKRVVAEFSSSLLKEGNNVLKISADTSWAFRRVRIKNIYGYSSGFVSAVIFEKNNVYPDARMLSQSPLYFLLLILFSISAFVLNVIPSIKKYPPHPFLRGLKKIRYFVPGLFLVIILLPLFSKYKVTVEFGSVGRLLVVFFAMAYVFELKKVLSKVSRKMSSLAGIFEEARRQERLLWEKGDLVPGILIFCFIFFCLVYPGPKKRSGDSLEYCAMLVSWAEYFSPYVTEESWARLEKRLGGTLLPGEGSFFLDLKKRLPGLLKNGKELDLPHFWFYSLSAAIFYWPVRLASLDIRLCFMLLHVVLLLAAFLIISRRLGYIACLSLFFVIYASPLLWFSNNAHVEFFTVILTLISITLFITEDYTASAFGFAIASTQNPPFAILCFLVFVFGFFRKKWALVKGRSLFFWLASFLLTILHPAYYYLRLGVLNTVVATGGAKFDRDIFSLKKMFCIILDPDIGLFVNWLVALPLLLVFAFLAVKKQTTLTLRTGLFLVFSALVFLWSQSRTSNLNHGGTYHISRYASWYLYIFFLMAWQIGVCISKMRIQTRRAFLGIVILIGFLEFVQFWPARPETYVQPTWASRLLYDRCPSLYDPMPEIFIERYRGKEEKLPDDVWAVSNPSGNKILIRRDRMMGIKNEKDIPPIGTCQALDRVLVYREAKKRFAQTRKKTFLYINGLGKRFTQPSALLAPTE